MPKHQVYVITDYKNLTHFTKTKELNRRQVRQVEELVNYNFRITYQKGSENTRVDILSRRLDYEDNKTHISYVILLENPDGLLEGKGLELFTLYRVEPDNIEVTIRRGYKNDKLTKYIDKDDSSLYVNNRKIYIPKQVENRILNDYYNQGYRGIASTIDRILQRFYIPNLRRKLETLIAKYDICKRTKYERHKLSG